MEPLIRTPNPYAGLLFQTCVVRMPCSGPRVYKPYAELLLHKLCCEGPLIRTPASEPYSGLLLQTCVVRGPCPGPEVSVLFRTAVADLCCEGPLSRTRSISFIQDCCCRHMWSPCPMMNSSPSAKLTTAFAWCLSHCGSVYSRYLE